MPILRMNRLDPKEMAKSITDGIDLAVKQMKEEGIYNENTTSQDISNYAASHILIKQVNKPE